MTVSKDDFLTLGQIAVPDEVSEIELRSGIRNLYYGVYHGASELKGTLPEHSRGSVRKGVHDVLVGYYTDFPIANPPVSKSFAFKLRAFGYLLQNLKTKRKIADYELGEDISPSDYLVHFHNSKKAAELVNEIVDYADKELG